jgi:hypothetical protein
MYKEIVSLTILNDTSLKTHDSHSMRVDVVDFLDQKKKSDHSFLEVDMIDIDMILRMS